MKNNSISIESMMDLITDAIQFKFAGDPSSPGLLVSRLKTGEMYVSILRFKSPFGKDKTVVFKAKEKTLKSALANVAKQIATDAVAPRNPVEELKTKLGL